MNNRIDGITIITAFLLTILFAWFESSAFCMIDRFAFVALVGVTTLWAVSRACTAPVYTKNGTPLVYAKPQPQSQPIAEEVSIEQFESLQFDVVTPEEIQFEQELIQEIDEVFTEIRSKAHLFQGWDVAKRIYPPSSSILALSFNVFLDDFARYITRR